MFVTDKGLVKAGLVDEAIAVLKAGNVDYVLFDEVVANPPIALADQGAAIYDRKMRWFDWFRRRQLYGRGKSDRGACHAWWIGTRS